MINKNTKYNLLIVADSFDSAQIIKRNSNYNFITAKNEDEIIATLESYDISLLIFDIDFYKCDFIKVLKNLQNKQLLETSLVLLLSSMDNLDLLKNILKCCATDFLKKPFLNDEFIIKTELLIKKLLDKTLIKNQQEEIKNNLKKSNELINASINAMYIFKDNICIECNNEAKVLFEFSSKYEIIGKHILDIFRIDSIEHEKQLIDNKIDHNFQITAKSKQNKNYDLQIKERNISIGDEYLKIISAVDITDIKRTEQILAQKVKLASMGEMIGNIAHQWRQPLTAISIAASGIKLMYECDLEERAETIESLDNIVKNTKYLSETIEDFKNFMRNDRECSAFFIEDLIQTTLMIVDANIKLENIKVIKKLSKSIEINNIQNDLVQVLLNIINNAVDVIKEKKPDKKVILIDIYQDNKSVNISINDSAGGIKDEIKDKVFEPYFTTKHQFQGTGLGLYMTHQIILKLGGKIEVTNETFFYEDIEYRGAKFTVSLPLF